MRDDVITALRTGVTSPVLDLSVLDLSNIPSVQKFMLQARVQRAAKLGDTDAQRFVVLSCTDFGKLWLMRAELLMVCMAEDDCVLCPTIFDSTPTEIPCPIGITIAGSDLCSQR
jgi:hypothetical protein